MLEEQAFIFFKVDTIEDAINELKLMLKTEEQYSYYDYIYKDMENNGIIKGYSKIIKLLIFSIYYFEYLYDNKHLELFEESIFLFEFLLTEDDVINDNMTLKKFINYIYYILLTIDINPEVRKSSVENRRIPTFNEFYLEKFIIDKDKMLGLNFNNTNGKYFLPYFIIGNKSLTYDKMMDNLLLNDNIVKIFISVNLYETEFSPHEGFVKKPYKFFHHDLGHYLIIVRVFDIFKNIINKWIDLYIKVRKNYHSYIHRFISFILWFQINEGKVRLINYNNFEELIPELKYLLNNISWNVGTRLGLENSDLRFVIRYILRSNDLDTIFDEKNSFNVCGDMIYIENLVNIPNQQQLICIFDILSKKFIELFEFEEKI